MNPAPTSRPPALRRGAFLCPPGGSGRGETIEGGGRGRESIPRPHRERRGERMPARAPARGDERGRGAETGRGRPGDRPPGGRPPPLLRPEARPAPAVARRPSGRVYRRNPCPKARRPPFWKRPPAAKPPTAACTSRYPPISFRVWNCTHLFHFDLHAPCGLPCRTELRLGLGTRVVGLRSGRWLTKRSDASGDKSCVRVLTKLRIVW